MEKLFAYKQKVRALLARLWPFIFLTILLLVLLQPQQGFANRVHLSALGDAVFGVINGNHLPGLRDGLSVMLNVALWLGILVVAVRALLGLLAGDRRVLGRLTSWLKTRSDVRHIRTQPQRVNTGFNDRQPQRQFLLHYTTAQLHRIHPDANIQLQDTGFHREGWRPRLSQRTAAYLFAPASLPRVHIIAKRQVADETTIMSRLRDAKQYFQLEGDFSQVFDVYAARGFETSALAILQPNVMHRFMQECPDVDIELEEHIIRISRPGLAASPAALEQFEKAVLTCHDILAPHLTKQAVLQAQHAKPSHHYELTDPQIHPPRFVFDRLLKAVLAVYAVLLAVVLVSAFLPLSETTTVLGGLLEVRTPWFDTLEALAYLWLALTTVVLALSELEVTIRRAMWRRAYILAKR